MIFAKANTAVPIFLVYPKRKSVDHTEAEMYLQCSYDLNKIHKRQMYDLELKSVLNNYEREIKKVALNTPDKTPQYFWSVIKFAINEYCKFKGIQFDGEVQILTNDLPSFHAF